MDELMKQLAALQAEIKSYREKGADEVKQFGSMLTETKTAYEALQKQVDAIDKKLTDKHAADVPPKTLVDELKENESLQRLVRDGTGKARITLKGHHYAQLSAGGMEQKTTILNSIVGFPTVGVLQSDRTPGIVLEARQALSIRGVLASRPTSQPMVDFVKVNSALTSVALVQSPEGAAKTENAVTFTTASEKVRTLATIIPASRQVLDDMTELQGFLQAGLPYYVNLYEEQQLLNGVGAGEDLNGLRTQATAFDTSLLPTSPGWTKIDIVGRAVQQVQEAKELAPTFVVVHPRDYWGMRMTKDTQGRYILGDPQGPVNTGALWGLNPVVTTTIATGTFLVGSGSSAAAEIRDRMEMVVEISTEHSDYFAKNLVAIRAEKRLALVVYRPASYIKGSFTTSP